MLECMGINSAFLFSWKLASNLLNITCRMGYMGKTNKKATPDGLVC